MKKLTKLKLNVLSDANLQDREMNRLRGGAYDKECSCSCYSGVSMTADNAQSNAKSGYYSAQGCNQYKFTPHSGWSYCDTCTA